jgi:ribokinase
MNDRTALFVGDVSYDLTMACSHIPAPDEKVHVDAAIEAPGGVAANAAVACALAGATTQLVVAIGDDLAGQRLVDELAQTGVEVFATPYPGSTARVVTLIEPHGEKRLLMYSGVSMYPKQQQLAALPLSRVGWVHTAVYDIAAAEYLFDQCRIRAIPWSLDLEPSTFPDGLDRLGHILSGAAAVFCNARAMSCIGAEAVQRLLEMGVASVIETQGARGAVLHTRESRYRAAAPVSQVVDTTGAGDCLAGWFVAERLRGIEARAALNTAVTAATISCSRLGTQSSYPTREELLDSAA